MSSHNGSRGSKRPQGDNSSGPVSSGGASSSEQQQKRARPSGPRHAHAPTVRDLITDELAPLANRYWAPGAPALEAFEPQIVDNIYTHHLAPANTKAIEREAREAERAAAGDAAEPIDPEAVKQAEDEEEVEQMQIETQRAHRLLLLELSAYLEK